MRIKVGIAILAIAGFWVFTDISPVRGQSACSVDGTYQSDWGVVNLTQSGDNVSGTWQRGTVRGVRSGNIIRYTWYEGPVVGGRGWWRISPDCTRLNGPWGSGSRDSGGGNWNLHK